LSDKGECVVELPKNLHHKGFVEWNEVVKGLVEFWELAERYGLERYLEYRLAQDQDGALTVRISRIGNELRRLQTEYGSAYLPVPNAELLLLQALDMDSRGACRRSMHQEIPA